MAGSVVVFTCSFSFGLWIFIVAEVSRIEAGGDVDSLDSAVPALHLAY